MAEHRIRLIALVCLLAGALLAFEARAAAPEVPLESSDALIKTLARALNEQSHFEDHYEATVWLTDMNQRLSSLVPDQRARLALLERVHHEALEAGLDMQLVLAVIDVESRFDSRAVSSAGARGLMQVMPFWKNEIGREEDDLFDPATNLRYGCTILAWYLEVENGDLTRALARYNGSSGKTWYPERVMRSLGKRWWAP